MKYIIIALSLSILMAMVAISAFAVQPTPYKVICHHTPGNEVTLSFQNVQSYNGHLGTPHSGSTYDTDGACPSPTNTPTPTSGITPIVTPLIEPTVTPTATPSPTITPTVTVTPTPTKAPEPTKAPSGFTEANHNEAKTAPFYACEVEVGKVDALNVETGVPNDGAIELYWTPIANADYVNIYYSEVNGDWKYSVPTVSDNGHFTIGGLKNGQHYWFQIEGTTGSCVGSRSVAVDPIP